MDPYTVLGVSRASTSGDIRRAYIKRCKETHPDAGGRGNSPEQFREVRDAYARLGSTDAQNPSETYPYLVVSKQQVAEGTSCRCGQLYDIKDLVCNEIECTNCSHWIEVSPAPVERA